ERADVYAIGTILYQMITGRRYFEATGNIVADAQALQSHTTVRPRVYNRQIDSDLEIITLKALRSERSERYRNVSALKADIDHYLHGELISAKPVTVWALTQKTILRNKAMSVVIATFILMMVAGALIVFIAQKSQNDTLNQMIELAKQNEKKAIDAMDLAKRNAIDAQTQTAIAKKNEDFARQKELEAKEKQKQLEQEQFAKKFAEGQVKEVTEQSTRLMQEKLQQEQELLATSEQNERLRKAQEQRSPQNRNSPQDTNPEVMSLWHKARTLYAEPFAGGNFFQKKPELVLEQINQCMDLVNKILLLDRTFAPAWVMKARLHLATMELDSAIDTLGKAKSYIPPDAMFPPNEDLGTLRETAQKLKAINGDPFHNAGQVFNKNIGVFNYTTLQIIRYFAEHPTFRPGTPQSGNLINRPSTPNELVASLVLNTKEHPPQVTLESDPTKPGYFRLQINKAEDISSLAILRKLKISQLAVHGSKNVDWTTLEQMGLEGLDLAGSKVDQIPIPPFSTGYARLKNLDLTDTGIPQISALSQMPLLEKVNLARTPVKDISPLRGKRLKDVNLCGTSVSDISPIVQSSLNFLDITDAPIKTIAPLQMASLDTLVLSLNQIQDTGFLLPLRANKNIKIIRTQDDPVDQSAKDFWRRYDAGSYPASTF
ncbi:MAG: hypothetical protein ABI615_12720, partial [Chthoniobacterales bacterium]